MKTIRVVAAVIKAEKNGEPIIFAICNSTIYFLLLIGYIVIIKCINIIVCDGFTFV